MKISKHILFTIGCVLAFGAALVSKPLQNEPIETRADSVTNYPRNGQPGNYLYVNGYSTYFNTGEADLAVYFYNNTRSAWSERISHRLFNDILPVMLPYVEGSTTWTNCIVTRYNPNKNPQSDGWDGVYEQSVDVSISNFLYAQNLINITGRSGGKLTTFISTTDQYGIRGENHMYLDLSGFTDWEQGDAKFALYFAYPNQGNQVRWGTTYSDEKVYYPSFCWKVEGQDNDHLYECIVPTLYTGEYRNIWSMVIAVRFDPNATEPSWDQPRWNQTQDISFNSGNHTANMIHINSWNEGQLDTVNIISQESRVNFYGKYFLDTVKCSGTGASDATTGEMWTKVQNAYNHLSRIAQGVVWTTTANENGNDIEKAMARYDYIVLFKQYDHFDYMNREGSDSKSQYAAVANPITPESNAFVITLAALLVGGVGGLVALRFIRGKKEDR